jgi:hypothetical protein
VYVEGRGCVLEMAGLVAPTIGAATTGLSSTHASAIWAMEMPRSVEMRCTQLMMGRSVSPKTRRPIGSGVRAHRFLSVRPG